MPLCKHCENLGLNTANTHWLREGRGSNSKIICPVLLNTSCRFCKENGHTISYCPQLKKKDEERISKATIEYNNLSKELICFNNLSQQNHETMFNDIDFNNIDFNECVPMEID